MDGMKVMREDEFLELRKKSKMVCFIKCPIFFSKKKGTIIQY